VNKEHTALKQRWSSLPAALRALLVRRLDGERNNAETSHASRASIRKEPPPRVDVDAEGRQVAVYPASIGQQRLWFLDQLDSTAGAAYNLATGLQLQGRLDRGALRATLDAIVTRHEAFRTSFVVLDTQPVQRIAPPGVGFHLIEHDLSGESGTAQQQRIDELSGREATERFDLSTGPLIRGQLLRLGPEKHLLLITQHHIISDGWSIGVLVREVAALYGAFSQGQPNPLPALPIQYADYAVWQRQWLQTEVLHEQVGFWRAHLAGAPGLLELPHDRQRPAVQSYAGGRVGLTLSGQLTAGLRRLSQRHGVTLFMSLLTGWAALLSRISGQSDLVIGTPVANRQRSELESLVGFFANTLALRVHLENDPSVTELLAQIRASTLEAYAHQDLPFAQLVEALQPARSLSYNPIFQAVLAFDNAPGERVLSLPGLKVSEFKPPHSSAKFDLTLLLRDVGERIEGALEYATDLFERASIERMATHLHTLLEAMVADDQQRISTLQLLSQAERQQLLMGFNQTYRPYPSQKCIHELFEDQVARTPEAVAVIFEDRHLSYGEINAHANQLAHHLIALGIRPDDRVGICMERSLDMVVGLLGIMKAGGAYVPLDPSDPAQRLAYMLEDSAPVAVLTQAAARGGLPALDVPVVVLQLQDRASMIAQEPKHNPDARASGLTSTNLAYVIYTSGSTGLPKGVMVEHRNVSRLVINNCYAQIAATDCVAHCANPAFDASTWEIWSALLNGAKLLVIPQSVLLDPKCFNRALIDGGVTALWLTAGLFNQYVDVIDAALGRLQYLLIGGDALDPRTVARILSNGHPPRHLINGYGPTETTTFASTFEIHRLADDERSVSIGRPIANTKIYILDARAEAVPIGVAGEIHIGGTGVARGYLNRPELTAQRFVADTFSEDLDARMYKTGDVGRWHPDGNIEFLGRNDFQVKVRGFRIELGEIEARLVACPGVHEAVVLAREDGARGKRLVAYVTEHPGAELSPTLLRGQLSTALPEYMVPSAFVILETFPLTSNGKLDRNALPAPDQTAVASAGYQAPVGQVEQAIAQIWQTLLGLPSIGRDDNFFELGGHSLTALRLVASVASTFGVKIGVAALFASPTLRAFAIRVSEFDRPPESWKIVQIQPLGRKTPIIAINNTMMYYDLAQKIGTDRRFLSVQLYDPGNPQPLPSRSLEEITTDYVHLIREAQPHGPYILVGLCVAGLIAYEAARQLRQAGEPVALVVMADTWCPGYVVRPSFLQRILFNISRRLIYRRHTLALLKGGAIRIDQFLATTRLAKWNRLMSLLSRLRLIEDPSNLTEEGSEDRWFLPALVSARNNYQAPVSTGDVVLLESEVLPLADFVDPTMGWSDLVKGQLLHYRLSGWHDRMFHDEGAATIAEHLRPLLDRVDAEARSAHCTEVPRDDIVDFLVVHPSTGSKTA
jgi:amino acid adenylation domain-containing protein